MTAKVRASPISKTASMLMVALGVFTLISGLVTGILANTIVGGVVVVLGLFMYRMLLRFNRRLEREIGEEATA